MDSKAEHGRTLVLVEDDPAQSRLLTGFLGRGGLAVVPFGSAEEALSRIEQSLPDLVLLDVHLPGMSGIEALSRIRRLSADLPVILITAHADIRQAVAAIKTGADDYLAKPLDLEELRVAVEDALARSVELEDAKAPSETPPLPPEIVCESLSMRRLTDTVASIAPSDVSILVTGESGTGKEIVARLIHVWSARSAGPFVIANCASFAESLVESELFGHEKGSFTGASQSRHGLFRTAHGGTLFLDEIGELPLPLQAKLLRAVESRSVVPVGADRPIEVDVRVVAATNRDLPAEVEGGRFRADLYYRLAVVDLALPPLRTRPEDVLALTRAFAATFAGGPVRLSPRTTACLLAHDWPGNVRELKNAVQRACLLCRGDVILPEHLPPKLASLTANVPGGSAPGAVLSEVERATILAMLAECKGNRTQAARRLGISRRGLLYKLRAIELDRTARGSGC